MNFCIQFLKLLLGKNENNSCIINLWKKKKDFYMIKKNVTFISTRHDTRYI